MNPITINSLLQGNVFFVFFFFFKQKKIVIAICLSRTSNIISAIDNCALGNNKIWERVECEKNKTMQLLISNGYVKKKMQSACKCIILLSLSHSSTNINCAFRTESSDLFSFVSQGSHYFLTTHWRMNILFGSDTSQIIICMISWYLSWSQRMQNAHCTPLCPQFECDTIN